LAIGVISASISDASGEFPRLAGQSAYYLAKQSHDLGASATPPTNGLRRRGEGNDDPMRAVSG
jgi:hypothetical protein